MTADGSHSRLPGQPAQKDPGLEHGGGSGHGHGRGHGHGHGHGHHDSAMLDDLAMTTAAGIRASVIGLLGLLATALFQLALVGFTGSVALLSDTVHNLGDCLTALPIWLAFRLARRPATTRFTYGLGRVEDLAGLLVVAAIGASGVYAVFVSIDRLLHPAPVEHPWIVVIAGMVGVSAMSRSLGIESRQDVGSGPWRLWRTGSTHAQMDSLRSQSWHLAWPAWSAGRGRTRSSGW